METRQYNVYKYSELSDIAKQKALDYFARHVFEDSCDWEHIYDDAKTIAGLMGIDIDQICFSGFWSQGDGACFTGSYRYVKGSVKAVKDYAPQGTELHRIARTLQDIQRKNFYRLHASISHRGHYYHSGCMSIDVEDMENQYRDAGYSEDGIKQSLRDFADWIYSQLEKEYEYQTSKEVLEEMIQANDYDFTEAGEIA